MGNILLTPWSTLGEQNKTEYKLVGSSRTNSLVRIMQCYAYIHAGTQYVVLHIKLMLNVHIKMYAHNSQINIDHDILNAGHAKIDTRCIEKYLTL